MKRKVLVAVGHQIIVAAYFILFNKESYKELGLQGKPKKKQTKNYLNRINPLGIRDAQLQQLLEQRIRSNFYGVAISISSIKWTTGINNKVWHKFKHSLLLPLSSLA